MQIDAAVTEIQRLEPSVIEMGAMKSLKKASISNNCHDCLLNIQTNNFVADRNNFAAEGYHSKVENLIFSFV